jgi:hypothetical protein
VNDLNILFTDLLQNVGNFLKFCYHLMLIGL